MSCFPKFQGVINPGGHKTAPVIHSHNLFGTMVLLQGQRWRWRNRRSECPVRMTLMPTLEVATPTLQPRFLSVYLTKINDLNNVLKKPFWRKFVLYTILLSTPTLLWSWIFWAYPRCIRLLQCFVGLIRSSLVRHFARSTHFYTVFRKQVHTCIMTSSIRRSEFSNLTNHFRPEGKGPPSLDPPSCSFWHLSIVLFDRLTHVITIPIGSST